MLEKEETCELFKRVKHGDMHAREVLVQENMGLVKYEVYNKFRTYHDKEELISIGYVGLLKAVDSFDIEKGVCFSSYAVKVIDNDILMFLNKEKIRSMASLDEEIQFSNYDTTMTLMDLVSDDYDMVEDFCNNEVYQTIKLLVDKLPEKKRRIMKLYYGFYDRAYTQTEIAEIYSCSQSYIARVIYAMTECIAKELEKNGLISLRKERKKSKRNTTSIYEILDKYPPEQIDKVISYLSSEEKEVIILRYEKNAGNLEKREKILFNNTLIKMRRMLFNLQIYGEVKLVRKI